MKKITNSLLMLAAFLLFGFGSAQAYTQIPVPFEGNFPLAQEAYEYTAPSDGILTITLSSAQTDDEMLGSKVSSTGRVSNFLTPIEMGVVNKWELVGGETYYLEGRYITDSKNPKSIVSTSFESFGNTYPMKLMYQVQTSNTTWTASGTALESQGGGIYEGLITVPAGNYLRFYSGDNTSEWYGPASATAVTFSNDVFNGSIQEGGAAWSFASETTISVVVNLAANTVKFTNMVLPKPSFIIPWGEGAQIMYGFQIIWDYYDELSVCTSSNKVSVQVPGYDTPFLYDWNIQANSPGEEGGGEATGSAYPNTFLLRNFFYTDGDVIGYWQKRGTYTVTIPANTIYIKTPDGIRIPNPETVLTYYCAGNGGGFMEEAHVITPSETAVETLDEVVIQWPTPLNNYYQQLYPLTGVEATVTINGENPTTIYGTTSTVKTQPNRVTFDMSQFNNKPGVYEISFKEGAVYTLGEPYSDGLLGMAEKFTIYVGMDDPESVYLQFTGVTNSYQLAQVSEHSGFMYTPEASTINYKIDVNDDAYVTIWAPIEYDLQVIAPSELVNGTDYKVDYYTETDYNTDMDVNVAQISFYTEQCYMQTFQIQIGEEGSSLPVSSLLPEADPADESTLANEFPMYMTVNWENKNIQINPDCTATVTVLVDGKESNEAGIWNAVPVVWSDEWQTWEAAEEGQASNTLGLQIYTPYLETGSARITVNIPEGLVIIDGTEVNAEARFDYELIALVENLETTPRKGSQVFELSTVDLTWVGFRLSKNVECKENVVYGKANMFGDLEGAGTPVKSVTVNDNGSVTIDLGTTLEDAGQYSISIPEGYFILTNGSAQLPNPYPISLSYTIANYRTIPANYENVLGELSDFAVLGKSSISFNGDVKDVTVTVGDEPAATVASFNSTTIDGSPAIQFVLSTPATDAESYTITVPANTLTIDGVLFTEDIMWVVNVVGGAVADPEDGAELETLEAVNVNWSGSALTFGNGNVILSNGTQSFDVTKNAEITTYEVDYGWDVGTAYQLTIDFTGVAYTAGEYTLTIPAGFVYIDQYGMYNEEVVLHYTVLNNAPDDAVGSIEAETEGEAVYYNLNGQRVVNPERGIYIKVVNGNATKILK